MLCRSPPRPQRYLPLKMLAGCGLPLPSAALPPDCYLPNEDDLTHAVIVQMMRAVAALHKLGVAHGCLDADSWYFDLQTGSAVLDISDAARSRAM